MLGENHTKFDATLGLISLLPSIFDEFAAEYYLHHASSQMAQPARAFETGSSGRS
jgi:hypothetical protein